MDNDQARHKDTCSRSDASNIVSGKPKLWKEWRGNISKEKYLEANKKARRVVYHAKCKAKKGEDLERLCGGIIWNVICLRSERGYQKLSRWAVHKKLWWCVGSQWWR